MYSNRIMLICPAVAGFLFFSCAQAGDPDVADEVALALAANPGASDPAAGSEQAGEFSYMLLPELTPPGQCMPEFTLQDEYPTADLLEIKISRRIPSPGNQQSQDDTIDRMRQEISVAKQGGYPLHPDIFFLRTLKPRIDRIVGKCYAEGDLSNKRIVKKRDTSLALIAYKAECQRKGCSYFGYIGHSFKGCRDRLHGATKPAIYLDSDFLLLRDPTHVSYNPKVSKHSVYYEFRASCTKKIQIIPPPPEDH